MTTETDQNQWLEGYIDFSQPGGRIAMFGARRFHERFLHREETTPDFQLRVAVRDFAMKLLGGEVLGAMCKDHRDQKSHSFR